MRRVFSVPALGAAMVVLTVGAAPLLALAADHLDAPNLGSIHVDPSDNLSVTKLKGPLDINDVYVFKGASANHTVLAMTVNPAVNLGIGPSTFEPGAAYTFNIDTNKNSRADREFKIVFGKPKSHGVQSYKVIYERNDHERVVARGWTGKSKWTGHLGSFAGVRSDPFFFDLLGFLGTVKGEGTRRLDDGKQTDFFVGLNTLAIVLEVPNSQLGGNGRNIGVWGTTRDKHDRRLDQMGRPAINTVFNPAADKIAFNKTAPYQQPTAMGGKFRSNVIGTLEAFSALDSEGAYAPADAATLAGILLPDELRYDVGSAAAGPLNGRGLADDVIDVELNIVTGGFPFAGRNATGAIPTDMVGPHSDYESSFPYLGMPH
ncbi:MAG TPA: DUF4331 family protein [Patescibacteria group bacterium]|nr:DUF4331 family protein [Patescibacteria group bacterium]